MGSGFGFSGLATLKNNRKLLRKKKRSLSLTAEEKIFKDPKTASPFLLLQIREKTIRNRKKVQRKIFIIGLLTAAALLILLWLINSRVIF